MFIEESKQVNGRVETEAFTYSVDYYLAGGEFSRLHCGIERKIKVEPVPEEGEAPVAYEHVGDMYFDNDSKQINIPISEDMTPHVIAFEGIIKEVRGATAQPVKKSTK